MMMSATLKELSEKKVADALVTKLNAKTARVGIIGMGYVGLPLALSFAEAGFATTGFDIDPEIVKHLG
jgi:UDP-N-acetyl-D-glucosamine dehydrogenase